MTIFDLVFLAAVLASAAVLAGVVLLAVRGQFRRARRVLAAYAIASGAYLIIGVVASLVTPERVVDRGVPWCFDDWCLTAKRVTRTLDGAMEFIRVDVTIASHARRVSQRAKGAWLILIDEAGHRYAPELDPSAIPLDVLLKPGDSVATSRVFRLPAETRRLGLVTGHGGGYCGVMSFLVIGQSGCLFHKPAMIRIE
jgi:hypothetical protein